MIVVNKIFSKYLSNRLPAINAAAKNPVKSQENLLKYLLKRANNTEYGKEYKFSSIPSYQEFKQRLPLHEYNSIKVYIERIMKGEQNVLWPEDILWFSKSSGTTQDKSKFIPVSNETLETNHYKGGLDMYAVYYENFPQTGIFKGKALVIGGSNQVNQLNEKSQVGDISAVLYLNSPWWTQAWKSPPKNIAMMANWEEKIEKMAKDAIKRNITHIVGVPTWTVVIINRIFELTGKNNLLDVWPNLELYIHGGVSFTPYRDLFKKLIPGSQMNYLETFNASEGFFAVQDKNDSFDMRLLTDHGIFYEFIELDELKKENPEAIQLKDVETGKDYALVISTNSGLWRYNIGDTIRFTSTDPYRLIITGRTKQFINAFGEEVMVAEAEKAIETASMQTGAHVKDFTVAPVYFGEGNNGAHEWLIEFEEEPDNLEKFVTILDESLKAQNSDYEAKRTANIALSLPQVKVMGKGTFYNWMKKRGKLGGQNKVPRLSNDRKFVDDILNFLGSSNE
jgi:hypothetical protein